MVDAHLSIAWANSTFQLVFPTFESDLNITGVRDLILEYDDPISTQFVPFDIHQTYGVLNGQGKSTYMRCLA